MIKACARCGRQFEATCNRAKFCEECRPITRREAKRQYREAHREECAKRVREYRRRQKVVKTRNKFLAWRARHKAEVTP